jgi:ribosomal protein L21E
VKIIKLLFCSFLLTLPFSVQAQSVNGGNASVSVKTFVQGFYDWYVPKALSSRSTSAWSTAVKEKASCFSPELGRKLREDSEAQAKDEGEIVGLDFDPFLNSQDPGKRYSVGKVVPNGDSYLVEVHHVVSGKPEEKLTATAEVTGKNGQWYFVNFIYPNGHNVLGVRYAVNDSKVPEKSHFRWLASVRAKICGICVTGSLSWHIHSLNV